MQDKKLNTQESRRMLYLFIVRQAEGDSQSSLHPQESSCLAAASDAAHCLPPASRTAPSARTCWLVCFPEQTANHFFPVPGFYHMPLPVYQSEACILMKLIKDMHTTTSAKGIFK